MYKVKPVSFEIFGDEQLKLHSANDMDEKAKMLTLHNRLFNKSDIIPPIKIKLSLKLIVKYFFKLFNLYLNLKDLKFHK